ncbi:MAG: hypothetical protein AAB656_02650 [Patescibacteria group bacterium]
MLKNFKTDFWVHVGFSAAIIALVVGLLFVLSEVKKIKDKPSENSTVYITQQIPATLSPVPSTVATSTPSPAPTSNTVITKTATPTPANKTTYIPLTASLTTSNTDWTNVVGSETYIDLKNNYSANAYVTWEAVLSSTSGGKITARLYDATHGIGVDGSEISGTSTTGELITSGKLSLWSGNNLYKVQIKSFNSYPVTFTSGRIKLVY